MRRVELGHWHYLTWHLPAVVFMAVAVTLAVVMVRSIRRNEYGPAAVALRLRVVGCCALGAALLSGVTWPYLTAAASVTVDDGGAWHLANYLGVPIATIPASEVRALRGRDLGGVGLGAGELEISRADGSVIRTVRISRTTLDRAYRTLGYSADMVRDTYGDQAVAAHTYSSHGPASAR